MFVYIDTASAEKIHTVGGSSRLSRCNLRNLESLKYVGYTMKIAYSLLSTHFPRLKSRVLGQETIGRVFQGDLCILGVR